MSERPCFEIGLTMAGAISAGAYTAGVIDFLLEALDAIEDVRAGRDTSYLEPDRQEAKPVFDPPHDVRIKAMSGTSAGSMVTAIVTTILGTRIKPVGPDRKWTDRTPTGNPLYDAWVQDIHYDKLLSAADIVDGQPVVSFLNSEPLDHIVNKTLKFAEKNDYARPYAVNSMPVYFCISNLRGVRYSLQLDVSQGAVNEYEMSMHADWMGFNWSTNQTASEGLIPVSPAQTEKQWKELGDAALASGAFPVGLSARKLDRAFAEYEQRMWFIPGALLPPRRKRDANDNPVGPPEKSDSWESRAGAERQIPPLDGHNDFPDGEFDFLNVDGGIFNNEPLELTRRALAGEEERNKRDGRTADRAVILIDPFPNTFDLDKNYDADQKRGLLDVIKSLFPAMIAQARFKLDELALAKDPYVASRYAIMPVRYDEKKQVPASGKRPPEKYAIACGTLGGFGGFLSKAFRHHDFMLGRRNCQRFLAKHFMLPSDPDKGIDNPLFGGWKDPEIRKAFQDEGAFERDGQTQEIRYLPIIPLLGKLGDPNYTKMPDWPARPADLEKNALKCAVTGRVDALKDGLIKQYKPAWLLNAGMTFFWWKNKAKWIEEYAMKPVRDSLKTRGISFD